MIRTKGQLEYFKSVSLKLQPRRLIETQYIISRCSVGVLGASRSVFAVNQDMSYGIALLMTGPSVVAGDIVLDIFRLMQPTLDRILADEVAKLYSGRWVTNDTEESLINIVLNDGSLWITTLVLHETDVLRLTQGITNDTQKAMPINLWSTGRHHEFR